MENLVALIDMRKIKLGALPGGRARNGVCMPTRAADLSFVKKELIVKRELVAEREASSRKGSGLPKEKWIPKEKRVSTKELKLRC